MEVALLLGSRLRSLRIGNKMNQEELGKKLGVGKTTISQYESETRTPDAESLSKLATIFNVSVDYLLGRTDNPAPASSVAKDAASVEEGIYIAYLGGPPEEMDEVEAQHLKQELEEFRRFREMRRKQMEQQKDK
jgi:transcriptional regulator with XRE-family HTH domain